MWHRHQLIWSYPPTGGAIAFHACHSSKLRSSADRWRCFPSGAVSPGPRAAPPGGRAVNLDICQQPVLGTTTCYKARGFLETHRQPSIACQMARLGGQMLQNIILAYDLSC